MDPAQPPSIQEFLQIQGKLLQREGCAAPRTLPMAAGIHRDHAVRLGEVFQLVEEVTALFPVSMEEHQGKSAPPLRIMQVDVHGAPPVRKTKNASYARRHKRRQNRGSTLISHLKAVNGANRGYSHRSRTHLARFLPGRALSR